jgi:predicted transcriptional regulator
MGNAERIILDLLAWAAGGEAYQSDLVRQSGFSKSRISEVLSYLEENGLVTRIPLGKNFRVISTRQIRKREIHASKEKFLRLGIIRASEYPFVLPFERLLREKLDTKLNIATYDNGIDLSRDLSLLRLDLGIAPVLTHFMFFSVGSPIKMIAPAGSGGATILVNKSDKRKLRDQPYVVATTKLSTMELMLRSSISEGEVPSNSEIQYCDSPRRMMNAALSGSVDAVCMWEPYTTILLKEHRRFKRLLDYDDSGEHVCCALAGGNHLGINSINRIARVYSESLDEFRKSPERFLGPYAAFMRFDEKLMRMVAGAYTYPTELDHNGLSRQFEQAGIKIPIPNNVKDAVLPAG